jgi:hypothetical protein
MGEREHKREIAKNFRRNKMPLVIARPGTQCSHVKSGCHKQTPSINQGGSQAFLLPLNQLTKERLRRFPYCPDAFNRIERRG